MKRDMTVSMCEFCLLVFPFYNQDIFVYIKTLISQCDDKLFSAGCTVFICAVLYYRMKKHD